MFSFRFALISLSVLLLPIFQLSAQAHCPEANGLNRYVITKLRAEQPDSSADLIRIYYTLLAPFDPAKPTLLVLNGGPGGDHHIIGIFNNTEISKEMNVVSFDHRGLGCTKILSAENSDYEPLLFSMRRTAADIEAIRKDLLGQDGKWFVYGLSYGTMLGQQYTLLYPSHVQGLILDAAIHQSNALEYGRAQYIPYYLGSVEGVSHLFDKLVARYPDLKTEILRRIRPMTYGYFGRTQYIPQFFQKLDAAQSRLEVETLLKTMGDITPPLVGMMRQIVCEEIWDYPNLPEDEQYFFWQFVSECKGFSKNHRYSMNFAEELKRLSVRTFIWGGKFDPVTPMQAMREMHQLIPNSLLWENSYAGHCLIGEKGKCAFQLARMFFQGAPDDELKHVMQSPDCQSPPKRYDEPTLLRLKLLEDALKPIGARYPLF